VSGHDRRGGPERHPCQRELRPADTPYGVTVDGQYIYWSNFGTNTLGRANVDGGEVNQSFITGASGPDGVVVDGEHIYWRTPTATPSARRT